MKLSKEELQQLIDTYRSELRMLSYRQQQVSDTLEDLEKEERSGTPKKRAARAAKRAKATRKAASKRGRAAKKTAKKAAKKTAKKAAKKSGRKTAKKAAKRGRPAKKTAKKAAKKAGRKSAKKAAKRGRPAKKTAKKAAAKRGRKPAKKAAKRGRPARKAAAKKSTSRGYRLNAWDDIVMKTLGRKKVGVFADFLSAAKKTAAGRKLSDKALYARINQSLHKLANKRGTLKKVEHEGRGFGYTLA